MSELKKIKGLLIGQTIVLLVVLFWLNNIHTKLFQAQKEALKTEVVKANLPKETKTATAPQRQPTQVEAAYIDRFARVAKSEMESFGIPASITLAQGLLETKAGQSILARKGNNHFGIKCFNKSCPNGHCMNYNDDSHKDFFRIYPSAWESYRAHSKLLVGHKRYKHLVEFGKDYKRWAMGLKKAGYATDPRYADKLIRLIEELRLNEYDL